MRINFDASLLLFAFFGVVPFAGKKSRVMLYSRISLKGGTLSVSLSQLILCLVV